MFDIKTTVEASELLDLTNDVKPHLAITHTDDDTYLTSLMTVARKQAEMYCGVAIGSQTKVWTVDASGDVELNIPYGPVSSVSSVFEKTDFGEYTELVLYSSFDIDGQLNKTFTPFYNGRFKVTYVTGYTSLPSILKQAILVQIAYLYENRNEGKDGICPEAALMLNQFKDYSWV